MAQTLIDFSGLFLKVYLNDGTNEYMRVRNTDFSMAAYTSPQVIYIKRAGNTISQIDGDTDAITYGATSFADMLSQLETEIAAIPAEGGGGGGGNVVDTLTATLGAGNNTGGQDIEIDANDKIIFPIDASGKINSMIGGSWGMNILADATIILEIDNNLEQIVTPYAILARANMAVGTASSVDGTIQFHNSDDAAVVIVSSPTTKQLKIDNTGHDVEVGINGAAVSGVALAVTGSASTSAGLTVGTGLTAPATRIVDADGSTTSADFFISLNGNTNTVDLSINGNDRQIFVIRAIDVTNAVSITNAAGGVYTFTSVRDSVVVIFDSGNGEAIIISEYLA